MILRLSRLLLVGLVLGSLLAWPGLPAELPVHFGLDGRPDRWAERSLFAWFALPMVGLLTAALFGWIRKRAPDHPEMLNVPGKQKLMALPPELRARATGQILKVLDTAELWTLSILVLIQIGEWVTATGGAGRGWVLSGVALSVMGSPVLLVLILMKTQGALREAESQGGVR